MLASAQGRALRLLTRVLTHRCASSTSAAGSVPASPTVWETLLVSSPSPGVLEVLLNRPTVLNAMNRTMWREVRELFQSQAAGDIRVVILSASGPAFTSGLDLFDHQDLLSSHSDTSDVGRTALRLREAVAAYQASFTAIAQLRVPVIAAVHGACIGAGVDMVCAADIRLAASDAYFCVKEVAIGMAADVGTLQRLPRLVGNDSIVRELCLTGRNWPAEEALRHGFLSSVHVDRSALLDAARGMAARIASLSPLAVTGTKVNLNYARDHTTAQALEYQALWNAAMLQGVDVPIAVGAAMAVRSKEAGGKAAASASPVFPPLS